jgi:hypothetical protein
MAWRAVDMLRRQPGFWASLAGCLEDGDAVVKSGKHEGGGDAEGLDAAWRLDAEAAALQLLSVEAFAQQRSPDGDTRVVSAWKTLYSSLCSSCRLPDSRMPRTRRLIREK